MKFAIIKERKNPPDRRVVFSPEALMKLKSKYKEAELIVESSGVRVFNDKAYSDLGFNVLDNVSEAEVLIGVKEVPIEALIPNKKYFFFSHTIKEQPYNRELLKAILDKNITLYDHETIVNKQNKRLIGFGYYAGVVGAYNCFRAYGLKHNIFNLPKAQDLKNRDELNAELDKLTIPVMKIVLTGTGKVGNGAKEVLDHLNIKEVSIEDYLSKTYTMPVYVQIGTLDYNERKDGVFKGKQDFYENAEEYKSTFMKFAEVSDVFIAGHFHGEGAPYLFTREDAKSAAFNISLVADISCDIDGPVACTLRASTIKDPVYGYDAQTESEVDYKNSNAIVVMAVDNLPCELPDNASRDFGVMFLKHVIPAFFNGDENGVLERAKITENGQLTPRFSYLKNYVNK